MARVRRKQQASVNKLPNVRVESKMMIRRALPWSPYLTGFCGFLFSLFGLLLFRWLRSSSLPTYLHETAADLSSYERGLVTTDVSYLSILNENTRYWKNTTNRHFHSAVLAYVTPWNEKGYALAKKFRSKLTHVSPVWYQLRSEKGLELHGKHNVDAQWIEDLRTSDYPLIVPRVVLEGWPLDQMLLEPEEGKYAIHLLTQEVKRMNYDGIVLEAWSQWTAYRIVESPRLRHKALGFLKDLGSALHSSINVKSMKRLQLFFVIPPLGKLGDPRAFSASDAILLGNDVDGYSLMTYDYSYPNRPGPSAPLEWVHKCLHAILSKNDVNSTDNLVEDKVLMGVNFFGNDFALPQGGGPIIGHEFISLLALYEPQLIWDESSKEHYFDYTKDGIQHRVFYPSLKSLSLRLQEARKWNVGITIWEIGQGLDYFFDLL